MTYKSRIVAAVEIGTSKITVLVGEVSGSSLNVIGFGEAPSRGSAKSVLKGVVVDAPAAGEATHRALVKACDSAGARIDKIYLAQSGGHLDGFYHHGEVSVSGLEGRVSQLDMDEVYRLAKMKALPPGRCIVHWLRRPYQLDGVLNPTPEHVRGSRLSVGVWHIHADERRISDSTHIIRSFNLPVSQIVVSGLACGNILTTNEERQHGVLVIDIGAGTTDYAYYRHGCAYMAGVLPVGGDHFTNDLSLGLRITESQADKMKTLHGRATVTAKDRHDIVWLNGDMGIGDRKFPRMTIEQITTARATEIFEVVRKKLGAAFSPEDTLAGVVLSGGTSVMPGMDDAASRVFGTQARVGSPRVEVAEKLRHPAYATALGLLHQGLVQQLDEERAAPRTFKNKIKGLLDRLATA